MSDEGPATHALAEALLGPVMAGAMLQLVLFGLLVAVYCAWLSTSWARASRMVKGVTSIVMILTTVSTGLNGADIWHFATLQERTASDLLTGTLAETTEPLFVGAVGVLVQGLLAWRAAKLVDSAWIKWVFVCVTGVCSLVGFIGSLGTVIWGVVYFKKPLLESNFKPTFNDCVAIWLWTSAGADVLVTATFIWAFRKRLSNFRDERTNSVILTICILAIRSAAFTVMLAVPGAILSVVFNGDNLETTDIAYAFWIPLPAMYSLSLFCALSAPTRVSHKLKKSALPSGTSPPLATNSPMTQHQHRRASSRIIQIPHFLRRDPESSRKSTSSILAVSPPPPVAATGTVDQTGQKSSRISEGVIVEVELCVQEDRIEDSSKEQTKMGDFGIQDDGVDSAVNTGSMGRSDPDPRHLCPA